MWPDTATWQSLLLIAFDAAPAPAEAAAQAQQGPFESLLMFAPFVIILVLYFVLFQGPMNREGRERQKLLDGLKKHDEVLTIGGIYGTVVNISGDGQQITLRVDDNTRLKFARSAIQKVVVPHGEKPAEAKA
jgi:preprotein translocase subunit YajC